jgi:hypothetical protein
MENAKAGDLVLKSGQLKEYAADASLYRSITEQARDFAPRPSF